ncbi:hypothetical protein LMG3431_05847 [Achromobacter pestifer]|uniref:Uncharacterized protein n=1 Tax=Achromobacter pestifer TaxID=1353889 RepID=A0A6S7AY28_9BURK|nr:hypothetical protein LMG3431_05847 [Achromobacter pestifer]
MLARFASPCLLAFRQARTEGQYVRPSPILPPRAGGDGFASLAMLARFALPCLLAFRQARTEGQYVRPSPVLPPRGGGDGFASLAMLARFALPYLLRWFWGGCFDLLAFLL